MLPVIALVGRPNVGKSTLFNFLTKTRDAIVADFAGLTRDRQYGRVKNKEIRQCLVVDTGGIMDDAQGIDQVARKQVQIALEEADIVFFMVDGRAGLSSSDKVIADTLRRLSKPVILVTNKTDGVDSFSAISDFYSLGLGEPIKIAASHGTGIPELLRMADKLLPIAIEEEIEDKDEIRIAIVGRPNVGKSTLVNRLLGEERVVVFDEAGTTRDSIYIPFERDGKKFTLIDTAGMRRRSKIGEAIEKFSVLKALQAVEKANVVIYMIDAREGITDQDAHLLGLVLEAGRALIIGLNKWDGISTDQKNTISRLLEVKLTFVEFAEKHPISALHGSGVGKMFDRVQSLYEAAMLDMSTPNLTRMLKEATLAHQPPIVNGRRIKLKYAHQGGRNPPIVVIHGAQTDELPESYKRYLINYYRTAMQLSGTPIRIVFKSPVNPFHGTKPKMTEWAVKKRERLTRRAKAKSQ